MFLCRSALALFCCALFLSRAHSDDQLLTLPVFEPVQTSPIFEAAPGQWDAKIRERGWVMREGDVWKMWYTGYDPDKQPLTMKLGYATSKDGITWTRHPQNPIISDFWVEDIMIIRNDQRYLMFAEGAGDQAQLLESNDGIQWKRLGTLDVRLTNGQPIPAGPYGTPTAWFEDSVWNLFYERRDAGIWLARSTDLKTWTNVSDEPIITPGPEQFDSLMIAMNQVIKINGKYVAVLHGTGSPEKPRQWCTTLFESSDLIHWKKSAHNPLRPVEENKSSGVLVQNGTGWRLYTMHDKVFVHELK
jgi:beta-1,2-mannobiose phosphorylase / 1,2-beta-oligomannan phosphorylase